MRILYDLQAIQSPGHADRGIARYAGELARALLARGEEPLSRILLNPDLPVPPAADRLLASGRVDFLDRIRPEEADVYHAASIYEYVPLERIWPAAARTLPLVVTLYDLIPEVFPEQYLERTEVRRWYRTRTELLRRAAAVIAISQATADDAVERLGLRPGRIVVAGAGVSEIFQPPDDARTSLEAVRTELPQIRPGYVLYTGGIEFRKNVDRLLEAYAALPAATRTAHQLVVVCAMTPAQREAIETAVRQLAIGDDVVFTGFVPDPLLVSIYQAAELFVFPALYEGYGLPIAEAQAAGLPVLASRSSSLAELVSHPAALFNPYDVRSIRDTLQAALSDPSLLQRLRAASTRPRRTWEAVADDALRAYELACRTEPPRRRVRKRPRIAYVTPLPPQPSGVADYSYDLLAELTELCDVDAYVESRQLDVEAPPGVAVRRLPSFERVEAAHGGYDRVIVCLGNSEFHAEALAFLRGRRAVVHAHDVRLSGLYAWSADKRLDLRPPSFARALRSMYGSRLPRGLGAKGFVGIEEADRYGIVMAREAIALSERFLVHSEHAAGAARLDSEPGDEWKVEVIPFAFPPPRADARPEASDAVVATFGVVAEAKQLSRFVAALPFLLAHRPDARLAIVGRPVSQADHDRYAAQAEALGVADRLTITGAVSAEELASWLARTTVAVQLRAASNGEASATVTACFAAGVPVIATDLGWIRELPDRTLVKVDRDVAPEQLAHRIAQLLESPARRRAVTQAAAGFARANGFRRAAEALYETAVAPERRIQAA